MRKSLDIFARIEENKLNVEAIKPQLTNTKELTMAKAKSKEQYVKAWQNHVDQMLSLCMDSGMPYEKWENEFKPKMYALIDKAAIEIDWQDEQDLSSTF